MTSRRKYFGIGKLAQLVLLSFSFVDFGGCVEVRVDALGLIMRNASLGT